MDRKFIKLGDLPDEVLDKIKEDSLEVVKILNNNDPKISFMILISVISNYIYKFEDYRDLVGHIFRSVEQSFNVYELEDS